PPRLGGGRGRISPPAAGQSPPGPDRGRGPRRRRAAGPLCRPALRFPRLDRLPDRRRGLAPPGADAAPPGRSRTRLTGHAGIRQRLSSGAHGAISSAGERCLHTAEVEGSKPPSPTVKGLVTGYVTSPF